MASLFIIEGADQGKRFEFFGTSIGLGRDTSNTIRLHDHEVSRKHAELRPTEDAAYQLVDLSSANGTSVNGKPVDRAELRSGDRIRIGQTLLLYEVAPSGRPGDATGFVRMLAPGGSDDRSAILRSVSVNEGSRILDAPGSAGEWLKDRLVNLSVMYRATQAISHIVDLDDLLPRILELVLESVGAERGAILLKEDEEDLVPKAVKWKGRAGPDERLTISRTIVDHVFHQAQGVVTSDPLKDDRFDRAQSIKDYGIVEAICVPIQGRHETLGVLYADSRNSLDQVAHQRGRFSNDHLMLMVAIGHQAGLAIENTRLYQAKLQAERLAAVGQTIATISHHVKNILQGIKGGSYLIELGLNEKNEETARKGWKIVEKNQTKIYNLVMDMLSYSKEREPAFEPSDLNEVVSDVFELMKSRAEELGVALSIELAADLPEVSIDPDGIHRAILNVVTNAIDACSSEASGAVRIATALDEEGGMARVLVSDNGPGIPESEVEAVFQLFTSTKGSRGTGLGLPVSRKIAREHGGSIDVAPSPGGGSTFVVSLPVRRGDAKPAEAFETLS